MRSHRYEGSYAEKIRVLEQSLQGFDGKRVLDLGCGKGEVSHALECTGAVVTCIDLENRHVSERHKTGSITELEKLFSPESFDCVLALAIFGSPLARWCLQNELELRGVELSILKQIRTVLKHSGLALVYNADVWLPHTSTLRPIDFVNAGFELVGAIGNDTILLRKATT